MSYGSNYHKKAVRSHAKKRAQERENISLNREFRRKSEMEIKNHKSLPLDSRCSSDPNRTLHWVFINREWFLIVYCNLLREIVTVLPKYSSHPYSPYNARKKYKENKIEEMWTQYKLLTKPS